MIILHKFRDEILCNGLSNHEFRCRCINASCTITLVHDDLLEAFEVFRRLVGGPLQVNSGYRCQLHNASLKGSSPITRHCAGMAVDIDYSGKLAEFTSDQVLAMAKEAGFEFMYYKKERKFFHLQISVF